MQSEGDIHQAIASGFTKVSAAAELFEGGEDGEQLYDPATKKKGPIPNLPLSNFVYSCMSSRTKEESANSERLRADYKAAFDQWASQVNRFRAISGSAHPDVLIQQEQSRVAAAENAYRDSRDRLTRDMKASKTRVSPCYSKSSS